MRVESSEDEDYWVVGLSFVESFISFACKQNRGA